jgi:ribosomal protein L40E
MIETMHTKTVCQKCGSTNVDWELNAYNQPAWGICRDCGATVEIQEVLDWRGWIAEAFAKLKSRRIQ